MTNPTCPECAGAAMADPVPLLRFRHTSECELQADLDSRRAADVFDSVAVRPATTAELALLAAHGWPEASEGVSGDTEGQPGASGPDEPSEVTDGPRIIATVQPGVLWRRTFKLLDAKGNVVSRWPERADDEDHEGWWAWT